MAAWIISTAPIKIKYYTPLGTDGGTTELLCISTKGGVVVAEKTKEERIKSETRKLMKIYSVLDENKLNTVKTLICRAAFLTVNLQDLEEELNANSWTEVYINGSNQSGVKKSAAADVYISLTKNLTAIIKQLLELCPPAQKKSKLQELMLQ